jgi:hypothetical protein
MTHRASAANGLLFVRGAIDDFFAELGALEVPLRLGALQLVRGRDGVFRNDPIPWACSANGG